MKKITDEKIKVETIDEVLKRMDMAKAQRVNFENTWQSVRDVFAPYHESITSEESEGCELDFSKIWTDEPIEAVRVFVAGLQTYLTPTNTKWVTLRMLNKATNDSGAVKSFLETAEDETMYVLANSNFDSAISEAFTQSIVYGTTTMMIEADEDDKVRFKTLPMKAVLLVEDVKGKVCEYFIEECMTSEQAYMRFGESLAPEMLKAYKTGDKPDHKYQFIYHIQKRKNRDKRKKDKMNMPIATQWIDVKNKHVCEKGGFIEMPVASHRFYKRNTTAYGYSPCTLTLASARTLNQMSKTNLRGGQKYVDPAIAVPSSGFLTKINTNPNGVNIYQKDVSKDSIFTLPGGQGVPFGVEYEQRLSDRMKRMLFNNVFNALSGVTKEMTVPEVQQRVQEAMTQIGPAIGRFQSEFLDPIITRVIGLLARGGHLPVPPPEMMQNAAYEIEYTSYLAMMQKKGSIRSVYDALGILQQLAAFDPAVVDNFNADEAWKLAADMQGLPAKVTRDAVQVEEIRAGRLQAENAQVQLSGIEQGARAAKDVASTVGALQ